MMFPPKGKPVTDANVVVRTPSETRPLGLKSTDNNIICSAVNHASSPTLAKIIVDAQRGFLRGRNSLNNVLDLAAARRLFS